jgi:hypothetical protein
LLGREHLRFQLRRETQRTTLVSAKAPLATSKPRPNSVETPKVDTAPTRTDAPPEAQANQPVAEAIVEFGQPYIGNGFEVRITGAKIDRPQVTNILGDKVKASERALSVVLQIVNTDDRKLLQFNPGNVLEPHRLVLHDDVDNLIRGATFDVTALPIGSLTGTVEIAPGASASPVEMFSVPPPKTQHLILTMDLEALGSTGEAKFKIPIGEVAGFVGDGNAGQAK